MYNLVDIHFHTDDSFDAFKKETFDIDKLISVLKDSNPDYDIKLLCKTDHNRFNFKKYWEMVQKFEAVGITLLPGIEINAADHIHWIFIFDNTTVNVGIPEYDDYRGLTLDSRINEYFGYDLTEKDKSLIEQAEFAQSTPHDIKSFIQILHELNIPYIAIPHLNKTKGYKSINSSLSERKILLIAAEILDGGKEAIRKRVRKIGYKDIFYKEHSDETNI